jgi:hypothetical protein
MGQISENPKFCFEGNLEGNKDGMVISKAVFDCIICIYYNQVCNVGKGGESSPYIIAGLVFH